MNRRKVFLSAGIILAVFLTFGFQNSSDHKVLFEKAKFTMETKGDLEGAIKLFEQILAKYPDQREYAAKSQLYIGLCYEKQGQSKAIKAYEQVVKNYPDQTELVSMARSRLTDLKNGKPTSLSAVDLDFYIPEHSLEPFDLSPDGTKMLGVEFDKGQNIVVCDLANRKLKFITNYEWGDNSCWTYNPIWSPDGKEVAFNANKAGPGGRSLMKSTLAGPPRVLLANEKFWYYPNAWMPDGKAILTIRGEYKDNTQEIGFVPSEGGEFKKLKSLNGNVTTSGSSRPPACVSPDGRFIAYTDIVPGGEKDIFIMSSEGKTSWPLIEHPAVQKNPRWSPDGKHIVFLSLRHGSWALWGVAVENGKAAGDPFIVREGMEDTDLLNWTPNGLACSNRISISDIYIMDVDPNTGFPVSEPRQLNLTPTGGNVWPVWSPDGKYIAFLRIDDISGGLCVIVCHADGSNSQEFPVPKEYARGSLRWMPDNSGIGMIARNFEWKNFVMRMDLSTEKWETLTIPVEGDWSRFEWSGNGKSFLYCKNGRTDQGAGIYEHDLETGTERLIYRSSERVVSYRGLRCSRDYKWLAFVEVGDGQIMVVNLETGESHQAAEELGYPCWSPDGEKILAMRSFGRNEDRKNSLFVLPSSGGTAKEFDLTKSFPQRSRMGTQDWSPDGKQVVFGLNQRKKRDALLYKNIIPSDYNK